MDRNIRRPGCSFRYEYQTVSHLCWGLKQPLVSWLLLIADHCISHFMADCGLHCFQQAVQPHLHLCVCVCVRERETELMIANWEFVGGHKMTPVSHDALHCEHALLSMLIHNLPPKHEQ